MSRMRTYLMIFALSAMIAHWSHGSEPIIGVNVLTGPKVRNNTVLPVVISLKTDRLLEGVFIVSSNASNAHNYQIPVSVGQGNFRYEVPYFLSTAEGDSVDLQVRFLGNVKGGSVYMPYPLESLDLPNRDELTVGWVSQGGVPQDVMWFGKSEEVEFSIATKERILASEFDQNDERWGSDYYLKMKRGLVHFSLIHPRLMAEDYRLYDAFDVLYISTKSVRSITAGQAGAIAEWVSQGGRLVVEGSAFSSAYDNYPIRTKLPRVASIEGVALNQVPMGLGAVVRSDSDMNPSSSPRFDERTVSFCQKLEEGGILPKGQEHTFARYTYGWMSGNEALGRVPLWGNILHRWIQLESVSKTAMISLLFVFVVLVTVCERLVLRRVKRLHFTWITTSAVVIMFCLMVNYISTMIRGIKSRQTTIEVVDVAEDGAARQSNLTCFIPSRSKRYTFATADFGQVRHYNYSDEPCATFIGGTTLNAGTIAPTVWSSAFIRTVEPVEFKKPFKAQLAFDGNSLRGTVTAVGAKAGRRSGIIVYFRGSFYEVHGDGKIFNRPSGMVNPLSRFTEGEAFSISPDFTERHYFYFDNDYEQNTFERLVNTFSDPAAADSPESALARPPLLGEDMAWILELALEPEKTGVAGARMKALRLTRQQARVEIPSSNVDDSKKPNE